MNNELIEMIEEEIGDWAKVVVPPAHIRLLQDCKAALTENREDEDHRELEYHLLASEMVYEGNSVQHWRQKALAYKECAGVIYELKSLLGVETPADVLEQVKTQQQEAEPVGWFTEDHTEDKSATTYDPEVAERWRAKGWPVTALYLHPPKPAAQPQVPEGKLLVDDIPVIAIKNGNIWHTEVSENLVTDDDIVYLYAANTRALLYAAKEEGK